jgi:ABC-type sugar transport system substrate-binding protein
LPEIPTTALQTVTQKKVTEENCPECTYTEIPLTGEELAAGSGPAKIVAYLQAHPDTDYLTFPFGGLIEGVPQAIQSAGLAEKVKIVGNSYLEKAQGEALKAGELAAWYGSNQPIFGMVYADAIARIEEGLPLPQAIYGEMPQAWMCLPETAEECTEWQGPPNLEEEFFKIWQVG